MDDFLQWLTERTGLHTHILRNAIYSVLVVGGIVLAQQAAYLVIGRFKSDVVTVYNWRKTVVYVAYFTGLVLVVQIWSDQISHLSTFLGLLSAGLAVALKDPIMNLAGWYFIVVRKPFKVGDRVQLGRYSGDVVDVRMFQFTVIEIGNWVDADQTTGRIVHVPNLFIFSESLFNYSTGFNYIWNEIPVMVTFESDWRRAKQVLTEIANARAEHLSETAREEIRQAAKSYMIIYNKLTPIVYTSVKESGVKLTIRYLCNPRQRRGTEQQIWEDVLDRFRSEPDVHFAYPTQRMHLTRPKEDSAKRAFDLPPDEGALYRG